MGQAGGSPVGSATIGRDFAEAVRDTADAHPNWTIEDAGVIQGTETYHVLKCAGAGNAAGIDFRVMVGYVTATPTLTFFRVAEGWDTGTNLATKYAFGNSVAVLDSDNSLSGTVDLANVTTWGRTSITPHSSANQRWDVVVNADRIMAWYVGQTSTSNHQVYCGLLERGPALTAGEAPMLCCITGHHGTALPAAPSVNTGGGWITRHPKRTAGSASNGRCGPLRSTVNVGDTDSGVAPGRELMPHVAPQGGVGIGADAFNNKQEAAKVCIVTGDPSFGGLIGYWKGAVVTRRSVTGVMTGGDTITIGSETYVYMGKGSSGDPLNTGNGCFALWASTAD